MIFNKCNYCGWTDESDHLAEICPKCSSMDIKNLTKVEPKKDEGKKNYDTCGSRREGTNKEMGRM